jgi:hypothetical protein
VIETITMGGGAQTNCQPTLSALIDRPDLQPDLRADLQPDLRADLQPDLRADFGGRTRQKPGILLGGRRALA